MDVWGANGAAHCQVILGQGLRCCTEAVADGKLSCKRITCASCCYTAPHLPHYTNHVPRHLMRLSAGHMLHLHLHLLCLCFHNVSHWSHTAAVPSWM